MLYFKLDLWNRFNPFVSKDDAEETKGVLLRKNIKQNS